MDQIYLLQFTTVSGDSVNFTHKNGSLLFVLCLYEISKILMVRAHIDQGSVREKEIHHINWLN